MKTGLLLSVAWLAVAVGAAARAASPSNLDRNVTAGVRVAVRVHQAPDGWTGDEVEILEEADEDEELRGLVESVDSAGGFRLLGFFVDVSSVKSFRNESDEEASLEDLSPGARVKVDGQVVGPDRFAASKVRIREGRYDERRLVGRIEAIREVASDEAVLTLLGREIQVSPSTDLDLGGRARSIFRPSLSLRGDDDVLFVKGQSRRHVSVAGELRLRGTSESNLDLDPKVGDSHVVPEIAGILGVRGVFGPVSVFAEAIGQRTFSLASQTALTDSPDKGSATLQQAYVELRGGSTPRVSVVVGRQSFVDEREWLYYAKNLDAVRIFADLAPVFVEASISQDLFDRATNRSDQDRTNFIVRAEYPWSRALILTGFLVDRRDHSAAENSPRVTALRITGSPGRHLDYWADFAHESGKRGRLDGATGDFLVRRIDAHAMDLGFTYRPRIAWDPSFTASFALGSGDKTAEDPVADQPTTADHLFRQDGLERNRDSYNGVVSFRYYGEVLNPELTNVRILTLAAGVRPIRAISFDLIYHRYEQDVAVDNLHGVDVGEDPLGLDPDLGDEWDIAFGYEPRRSLELRLTGGRFFPGAAFDPSFTPAMVVRVQSKFRF